MRVIAAIVLVASIAALSVSAAGAAPARTAKLTPAEVKWAKPVAGLWNVMNFGLNIVLKQATAKDALLYGSPNNRKLLSTLTAFALCPESLGKAGKPPGRLVKAAAKMKTACAHLDLGSRTFAKGLTAISKRNGKLGNTLITQAVGEFAKAKAPLISVRKQMIAVGSKSFFAT